MAVVVDPDSLDIRIPLTLGVSVGVGYVVAGHLSFTANLTLSGHLQHLLFRSI